MALGYALWISRKEYQGYSVGISPMLGDFCLRRMKKEEERKRREKKNKKIKKRKKNNKKHADVSDPMSTILATSLSLTVEREGDRSNRPEVSAELATKH